MISLLTSGRQSVFTTVTVEECEKLRKLDACPNYHPVLVQTGISGSITTSIPYLTAAKQATWIWSADRTNHKLS